MHSFNTRFNFLDPISFFPGYVVFYAVGEKETTVKQTSTYVVHLAVCISVLCVGITEVSS